MAFTFFFRDRQTLDSIVEHLIPFVRGRSKIKIWDAGCASGEEPYTFIILLAEKMGKYIFKNVNIHATDIDISDQFGDIIKNGLYPYDRLKRIPSNLLEKYFRKFKDDPALYQVIDDLRSKIHFKRENLLSYKPTDNGFSLIICKNVLLHQKYEERIKILEMFTKALLPGGILGLEQTQKMPVEIENCFEKIVPNAQIFRKKEHYKTECENYLPATEYIIPRSEAIL